MPAVLPRQLCPKQRAAHSNGNRLPNTGCPQPIVLARRELGIRGRSRGLLPAAATARHSPRSTLAQANLSPPGRIAHSRCQALRPTESSDGLGRPTPFGVTSERRDFKSTHKTPMPAAVE